MSSNEYFAHGNVLKFAHPVNGIKVEQRVVDGFINGTAMCVAHGKDIYEWFRSRETIKLLEALAIDLTLTINPGISRNSSIAAISAAYPQLVVSKRGSPENGGGTWLHPYLALQLAQWCNQVFALQVSRWVCEWVTSGQKPLKVDLDREYKAWQERYDFRVYLKDFLRPELMSAVVQWAEANSKSPITFCSQVHDLMNERIQGHRSRELKALNGLPLGELLRDYFEASPLVTYSAINTLARNGILDRGLDPMEAVTQACDQFLGKAYNPKPLPLAENLYAQGRKLKQARKLRAITQGTQLKLPFENDDEVV